MTDIEAIRQRRAAITDPPTWWWEGGQSGYVLQGPADEPSYVTECASPADAEFIAHAPADIDALLAEVERQEAEIERLREGLPRKDCVRYGIEAEPWEGNGPCKDCEGRSPFWHAPNEVWDVVMDSKPGGGGLICPVCFTIRAWKRGIEGWDEQWWWTPYPIDLHVTVEQLRDALEKIVALNQRQLSSTHWSETMDQMDRIARFALSPTVSDDD